MAERVVYWACEEGLCTAEGYLRRTTCPTCEMKLCPRCYQNHKQRHYREGYSENVAATAAAPDVPLVLPGMGVTKAPSGPAGHVPKIMTVPIGGSYRGTELACECGAVFKTQVAASRGGRTWVVKRWKEHLALGRMAKPEELTGK